MTLRQDYSVVLPGDENDEDGILVVKLTEEGIIADILVQGELVGTWAKTAEDLVEDMIFDPPKRVNPTRRKIVEFSAEAAAFALLEGDSVKIAEVLGEHPWSWEILDSSFGTRDGRPVLLVDIEYTVR